MKDVEHAVPCQRGDDEPKVASEAQHRDGKEGGHGDRLDYEDLPRGARRREEDVIGGDDPRDRGIKGPVPVQPGE